MRPHIIVQNEVTSCEHGGPFLANLCTQNILQKHSVVCRYYSGPRRHSVCCCHSILVISHIIMSLTFDCWRRHFFGPGEVACFHWEDQDFSCGSKSHIHVLSMATAHLLPYSSSSATFLQAAFCSSLSWCGTHFAVTFLFCSVWVTILKTEADDMFASCAISSHDLHRSSCSRVLTITTDVSSIAVTGCPLLGSSWMLNRPPWKRDAHCDTVLWSTTLSPPTSRKALWISVGFFS